MGNKTDVGELRRQWNLYVKSKIIDEYIIQCDAMSISPHRRIEKFILSDIEVLKKLKVKMSDIENKIKW